VTALATLGSTDDAEALGRALANRRVPAEATVLAAGTLLRIAPESSQAEAARRVLLAALGSRKTNVRGLAVEQLGAIGAAAAAWAKQPLEKLARSGKGSELIEPIAAALRAIDAADEPERGGRGDADGEPERGGHGDADDEPERGGGGDGDGEPEPGGRGDDDDEPERGGRGDGDGDGGDGPAKERP
jgi:hypothetical protein